MNRAGIERIAPTVIIGLGGTGAMVVHHLKRRLDDVPVVRFLVLDSDRKTQTYEGQTLQEGVEYVNLSVPIKIEQFIDGTWPHITDDVTRKSLNSWFPYPAGHNTRSKSYQTLEEGAGQVRCLGRVALFYGVVGIRDALANHLSYVAGDGIEEAKKRGINVDADTRRVFIISSLGGGQGTGMILDAAYLVQTIRTSRFEVNGFFILPTAFSFALAGAPGVWANSYAAMLEMEHYQKTPKEFERKYASNVTIRSAADPPFKYIYVASGNPSQGQSLSIDQVCQITSEALYSHVVIDTRTASGAETGKFKVAGGIDDSLRREEDGQLRCYSSFGYREIKLPGDQIAAFCRNRLAEKIAEALVTPDAEATADDRHVQGFVKNSKIELSALEAQPELGVSAPRKPRDVEIRDTTTANEVDLMFGQLKQDQESWSNTAKADMRAAIQNQADRIKSGIAAEARNLAYDPSNGGLHAAVWFIGRLQRQIPILRGEIIRFLDVEAERGRPGLRTQVNNRQMQENLSMNDLRGEVQRKGFLWSGRARKKSGVVETQIREQAQLGLRMYRLETIDELVYQGVDAFLVDLKNQWETTIRCVESVRDQFYRNKQSDIIELLREQPFYRTQIRFGEDEDEQIIALNGFARKVDAVKKAKELVSDSKGALYPAGKTEQQASQELTERLFDFCQSEFKYWEEEASVVTELDKRKILDSTLEDICKEGQYALWKLEIPLQNPDFIVKVLTVDQDRRDQIAPIVARYGVDRVVGVVDRQTLRISYFEYAARRSLMAESNGCKEDYESQVQAGNDVHAHLPFTKKPPEDAALP